MYGRWKDLIMRLRNISQSNIHVVALTPRYAHALLDASTVAMLTQRISELYKDSLLDPSPFDHLFQQWDTTAPPRYFACYDTVLLKDPPLQGPLTSLQTVVERVNGCAK
jgi:hypothetical protein